jgi:competence protein ComEC
VWHTVSNPLIMINSTANYSHLIGSEIQINDIKISAPKGDFRRFCVRRNILASLYIPKLSITMLNRPTYSLSRFLSRVQQKLITIFKRHLSRPTFTLFSAIFLGHTEAIKKDLKQYHGVFQRWGIVHYLARSGLHLVLVTIMLEYALSYIPLSFLVRRILIIGSASLYWLCTWSSVSFYRALALFFMVNTLLIARRPFHFLHLLFTLCALFLILNPSHLFFLDFQLTFGLTAILALFNSNTARHW